MLTLNDIVGQETALTQLQRRMGKGRLHHALMFAGPEGVGRETTGRALAQTLLCAGPVKTPNDGRLPEPDDEFELTLACGTCPDCRMMDAESHPDFQVVYKELARYHDDASVRNRVMQDLGIAVIRSFLIDPAMRAASRGRGKVFVVREAELMSNAAQNALLKTLEEPPAGTTIILLTRKPELLLPTTLSRCSMVRFGLLPRDFVMQKLTEDGIDQAEANFLAGFTEGSIGRALQLNQAGMFQVKQDMVARIAQLPPGGDADLGEQLAKTMDTLASEAVAEAKKGSGAALSKNLASRQAAGIMLEILASVYRDAVTLSTGTDRPMIHADQSQFIQTIAQRFRPTQLAEIIEQLSRFERLLWRNVNPKIVWDNVVITCASAAPMKL